MKNMGPLLFLLLDLLLLLLELLLAVLDQGGDIAGVEFVRWVHIGRFVLSGYRKEDPNAYTNTESLLNDIGTGKRGRSLLRDAVGSRVASGGFSG